jgi:hypothetical protein
MKSYIHEDRQAWARYLASLPPGQKCDCGGEIQGQCYGHCYGDLAKGGAPRPAQKEAYSERIPR